MAKSTKMIAVADEAIMNKIFVIRGQKIMIDPDLAELYEVETKRLKEAVRRNFNRFPKGLISSERSIEVNIRIIRIFTKMKEMLLTRKYILLQLQKIEKNNRTG